ncbi:hypothetical protein PRZ48_001232 [Zasmidium cellare]|uniref:Uncharacterized protein n=1 Tax=Zasmidium cellare TaxID=395010 RepID=A0ABR0F0Y3_ZASCE|nr:hypothetical protein PRZ48_001232 [Zasmidium cellare]
MPTQCLFCLEPKDNTIAITETHFACSECVEDHIVPRFHQALNYEVNYPVVVGETTLEPQQFLHWLKVPFVLRWIRRKEEYACKSRTYCTHVIKKASILPVGEITNVPLALSDTQQAALTSQEIPTTPCGGFVTKKTDDFDVAICARCSGSVTTCCGAAVWDSSSRHTCNAQTSDPLAHQIRGKDYQICPTTADSGHWDVGSQCPRWNHPDDENHRFDEPLDGGGEGLVAVARDGVGIARAEDFTDENGARIAQVVTIVGFDSILYVPFARLQQITRQHLTLFAEERNQTPIYPPWLDETLRDNVEVQLDVGPDVRFEALRGGNDPDTQEPRIAVVRPVVEDFFATRGDLLTRVVESLIPRPRNPEDLAPLHTDNGDILIRIHRNWQRPDQPAVRHEHKFSIDLHVIIRYLELWSQSQGRDMPVLGSLLDGQTLMRIVFNGNLNALRIDGVEFQHEQQRLFTNIDDLRRTNALVDALNDEVHMPANQLVRDILVRHHNPGWTVRE